MLVLTLIFLGQWRCVTACRVEWARWISQKVYTEKNRVCVCCIV